MPAYRYKAFKEGGKKASGRIEASNEEEARTRLRQQGLMVASLRTTMLVPSREKFSEQALVQFTLQLSQLIKAGVPVFESLSALEEQARGESYHGVLAGICEKIKGGTSLSSAMTDYSGSFDQMYSAMVASGEASGMLGSSLEQLHDYLTRQRNVKQKIVTAMVYPAVLASFAFIVVLLLLIFMVPSLEAVIAEKGNLGMLTQFVLGLSHVVRTFWWLYVPLAGIVGYGLFQTSRTKKFKDAVQRLIMKTPGIKLLATQAAMARFCTTMQALLAGGLPLVEALRIGRKTMKNRVLEEVLQRSELSIIEGSSLSQELRKEKLFPPLLGRMVAIGEESGTLGSMFGRIGEMYTQDLGKNLERLTTLVQPIILIAMGGLIGLILLALILPLMDVSALTG